VPGSAPSNQAGRDAVDDLDGDAFGAQVLGLFATAAEDEGVAPFQAHDPLAAPRFGQQQPLDERLRRAAAAATLADVHDARRAACVAQHAVADEVVDEQHGGGADRAHRLDRQQLGVARAGADEGHASAHADFSSTAACSMACSARTRHSTCWVSGAGAGFSPLVTDWM
jgi:hypothetical protein